MYAKQSTLGETKCEANQKQHASRQVQPKPLISAEAKKLATVSKNFNSWNDIQYFIVHFSQLTLSLGHLYFGINRLPSDKANCEKYTIKYCMSFRELHKL